MGHHFIGFGLAVSWLWISFLNGPLLDAAAAEWTIARDKLFWLFMASHAATYFGIGKSKKVAGFLNTKRPLPYAAGIMAASVLILGWSALAEFLGYGAQWLSALLAVAGGIGASVFLSLWLQAFAQLPLHSAAISFALGIGMAAAATIAGSFLSGYIGLVKVAAVAFPLLSAWLLNNFGHASIIGGRAQAEAAGDGFPFSRNFMLLTALFYMAGAQIYKLTVINNDYLTSFWLSNAAYAAVCLAAGWVMHRSRGINVASLFRPVLPLMAIGFFSVPLFSPGHLLMPFLLLQAGVALFDMYTCLYVVHRASRYTDPMPVIGLGMAMITGSLLLGEAFFLGAVNFTPAISYTNQIVFIGGVLSVYGAMCFKFEETVPPSGKKTDEPDAACPVKETQEKVAAGIAAMYKLTSREQEVLDLILKGRNGVFISQKLNISENTVKFHLRNIYGKFAVNNRQELLDLLDTCRNIK